MQPNATRGDKAARRWIRWGWSSSSRRHDNGGVCNCPMGLSPLRLPIRDSGYPLDLYGFYNGSRGIFRKSWAWFLMGSAIGNGSAYFSSVVPSMVFSLIHLAMIASMPPCDYW
jgi:hypothetical protein